MPMYDLPGYVGANPSMYPMMQQWAMAQPGSPAWDQYSRVAALAQQQWENQQRAAAAQMMMAAQMSPYGAAVQGAQAGKQGKTTKPAANPKQAAADLGAAVNPANWRPFWGPGR